MSQQACKLSAKNLSIEFPGVKALSDINFDIQTGDIRAVVGANGAGKSTLMKVFAGANPGYKGEVLFNDQVVDLRNPAAAKELGIEIVYQEVDTALFPSQTVAENIMMNKMVNNMDGKSLVNWKTMRKEAKIALDKLRIDIDIDTLVGNLTLAEKQMVLIARAIQEKCSFLILDEPTAPLSFSETAELFRVIRELSETEDIAIMYISHRLQEILDICKTITVMRNGVIVEEKDITPELTIKNIVDSMLGRDFNEQFPKVELNPGATVLEVQGLSSRKGRLEDINFNVKEGEIIGVSGLVGAGKTELCKALFGEYPSEKGEIQFKGEKIKIGNTNNAVKHKVGLIPEERRKEGIFVEEPIQFNLSIANLSDFSNKFGMVNRKKEKENAEKYIKSLGVKTPSKDQVVKNLSGGNQQKVVIGKWLAADCELYIFDEPTKGVDVGAKHDIFQLIQEIALSGKSVIYATSEISEILAITDRTYVMYGGKIVKELKTTETSEEEIMYYSTGGK